MSLAFLIINSVFLFFFSISRVASVDNSLSIYSSLSCISTTSFGLFLFLGDSLGFIVLINSCFSESEFALDFFKSSYWAVVPRMSLNFSKRNSLGGIELKHCCNHIFEFFTEEFRTVGLVLRMSFPEQISSVSTK